MPRYDIRCRKCLHIHETEHSITENPQYTCPECGSTDCFRYLGNQNLAVVYKGRGWAGKEGAFDRLKVPEAVRQQAVDRGIGE